MADSVFADHTVLLIVDSAVNVDHKGGLLTDSAYDGHAWLIMVDSVYGDCTLLSTVRSVYNGHS